jgi:hypothetical protein
MSTMRAAHQPIDACFVSSIPAIMAGATACCRDKALSHGGDAAASIKIRDPDATD